MRVFALLALLSLLVLGGCGKKGALEPPAGAPNDYPRTYPPEATPNGNPQTYPPAGAPNDSPGTYPSE